MAAIHPGAPSVALFIGDPAGIGPELVSRLLADRATRASVRVLLIADDATLADACRLTGVRLEAERATPEAAAALPASPGSLLRLDWPGEHVGPFEMAVAGPRNGRFMLDGLRAGLDAFRLGAAQALCFAPLNKSALRAGGMGHRDELHWFAEQLGHAGPCGEFNVLERLWTSRVTSHIALKDVAASITAEGVHEAIAMLHRALVEAGVESPRIGVCGLNPHNGDNGAFGREEIDVIAPGIARARAAGFPADGPYPADTIFVRAKGGQFDAIVTMYHDQGQIAMKLMGFERGVTVQGGLPVPITTPAHGTAYDIAGRGIAGDGAMRNAFAMAVRFAQARAGNAGRQ